MPSTFLSRSEDETYQFGCRLAARLGRPVRVFLVGDLGAGKTTLTRGLAAGFGVFDPGEVCSPTFALVNRYAGPVPLFHVDLYRLDGPDYQDIGLDEILDDDRAVVVVEWADRLGDIWLPGCCRIVLDWVDEGTRRIEVGDVGERFRGSPPRSG